MGRTESTISLLVVLLFWPCVEVLGSSRIAPQDLIRRVCRKYASFQSYEDEGVVETTYDDLTRSNSEKMPFKVLFRRPGLFRFEWLDYYLWKDGKLTVLWRNANDTFLYQQPDIYEKKESLERGIATVTGISDGAAYNIPRLLMPGIGGWTLTDLTKLTLVAQELFEGELCYHIKGMDLQGDVSEIWIGKRDYLVRKTRTQSTGFEDFSAVTEEIHRNIRINQPIAESRFEFKPPIAPRSTKEPPGGVLYAPEAPVWTEFRSEQGHFRLLVPAEPVIRTVIVETTQGRVEHHSYVASRGSFICVLDYADLSQQFVSLTDTKTLFDQARDELLRDAQGKLASETTVTFEGHPGREMRIHLAGGEARVRFFLVDGRFFQLAITRLDRLSESDADVDRFFNSFKVTSAAPRTVAMRAPAGRCKNGCRRVNRVARDAE